MKNSELNIKEKTEFIYNNSGIICSKLINDDRTEDILNYLQVFLLCDLPIKELDEICNVLIKKDTHIYYENDYNSTIKILFSICNLINESDYSIEGKESLKNKIRKYMKYIKYDESIRAIKNSYVKIKKETND